MHHLVMRGTLLSLINNHHLHLQACHLKYFFHLLNYSQWIYHMLLLPHLLPHLLHHLLVRVLVSLIIRFQKSLNSLKVILMFLLTLKPIQFLDNRLQLLLLLCCPLFLIQSIHLHGQNRLQNWFQISHLYFVLSMVKPHSTHFPLDLELKLLELSCNQNLIHHLLYLDNFWAGKPLDYHLKRINRFYSQ